MINTKHQILTTAQLSLHKNYSFWYLWKRFTPEVIHLYPRELEAVDEIQTTAGK